jgi:uncharacterized membrane protein
MSFSKDRNIARSLGWFSIGLGLAEVIAPAELSKLIGIQKRPGLLRVFGIREIAAGLAIFTQHNPAEAVWARVAGDAIDLAFLGIAFTSNKTDKERLAIATASVEAVTALDVIYAKKLSAPGGRLVRAQSITVNKQPEEVYQFWRDFSNLPRFMSHLESTEVLSDKRSHWVAKAPAGKKVEWDAEITDDKPNELIAWRSLENADIDNSGVVYFRNAPGGRGTEVHVQIDYSPPGGPLGAEIAKLFGEEPDEQIKGDLYRFKQVLETGEVVHSDASIHKGLYPGRPSEGESFPGSIQ